MVADSAAVYQTALIRPARPLEVHFWGDMCCVLVELLCGPSELLCEPLEILPTTRYVNLDAVVLHLSGSTQAIHADFDHLQHAVGLCLCDLAAVYELSVPDVSGVAVFLFRADQVVCTHGWVDV